MRYWKFCCAGAMVWAGLGLRARAEIVFDNVFTTQGSWYPDLIEYGDELNLVGSARTVVDFRFEYYAEFETASNQTARVRFYANDGAGNPGFQAPGTVIYDSGTFPIAPGYQTKALTGMSVTVSNRFTWSVQFGGVSNVVGTRAGVTLYDPPTAGFSFNDFWRHIPDPSNPGHFVWALYQIGGYVSNFAIKVTALPDPAATIDSQQRLTNGLVVLQLTGPVGRDFVLEASTNQTDWLPLSTNTLSSSPMNLLDDHGFVFNQLSYRAVLLPATTITLLSPAVLTNRQARLSFDGPVDRYVTIDDSTDLVHWATGPVRTFVGEPAKFVDPDATNFTQRFYRGSLLAEPPAIVGTNFSLTNGVFDIPVSGRPGHDFIVLVSSNLVTWTAIATNTYTFTGGFFDFTDPDTASNPRRFYLIVPQP